MSANSLAYPIDWVKTMQLCVSGMPMSEVARIVFQEMRAMNIETTEKRIYQTIRQRSVREQWPIPTAIIKRIAGINQGGFQPGMSGPQAENKVRDLTGLPPVRTRVPVNREKPDCANTSLDVFEAVETLERGGETPARASHRPHVAESGAIASMHLGQYMSETADKGLLAVLQKTVEAAETMEDAPPVRTMNDLKTLTEIILKASGKDKPAVAIQVNSFGHAPGLQASYVDTDGIQDASEYQDG
jgi:hypothetical protein